MSILLYLLHVFRIKFYRNFSSASTIRIELGRNQWFILDDKPKFSIIFLHIIFHFVLLPTIILSIKLWWTIDGLFVKQTLPDFNFSTSLGIEYLLGLCIRTQEMRNWIVFSIFNIYEIMSSNLDKKHALNSLQI